MNAGVAINNYNNLGAANLIRAKVSSSPVAFPVKRSQYIYARFKNITSTPVSGDTGAMTLSKLRIIDTLVGRLKETKGFTINNENIDKMSGSELNVLISNLSKELSSATQSASVPAYKPALSPGTLINTFA